jgi:multidrug efflux system membrane fusion protein
VHKLLDRKANEAPAEARELAKPPTRPRRRGWRLGLGVAVTVLAGVLLWRLLAPPGAERTGRRAQDAATVVRLGAVTREDVPVSLDALGTVTALATVSVKTQISGKIVEVGFQEGQSVKKGDFLVQIDPRPYQAALDQAQGQLARDQALLAAARVDLARYERLITQDSIARQQVDTQRALVKQDEALVRSDAAMVDNATLNLNYCHIVAPVDGRIGLRLVDPGNYVQPNDPAGIVVITQMQPISVIFPLPQDTIPRFLPKLRAATLLPVLAYNRGSTTLLAKGTLTTIDNQIDTSTGTVKLRATFPNEDEALFPNQFVNVKLIVETLHDAVVVPSAAVQIGAPGSYVYVANADQTVSVRPIKVGPSEGERVAVLDGLAAGDKVVIDGVDRLRDGARIRVPDAQGAAPAKGGKAREGEPGQRRSSK